MGSKGPAECQIKKDELSFTSDELLFKAFACSPCPMAISEFASGRYIFVNDSFTKVTGYPKEEIIGEESVSLNIWANPNERKIATKILSERGFLRNFESSIITKNGQLRVGLFAAEFIKLSNNQDYILSLFYDMTELKQEEKKRLLTEQQLAIIYNDSPVYISLQRLNDACYVNANDYFLKTMGYTREEVIGKDPVALGIVEETDLMEVRKMLNKCKRLNNLNVRFKTRFGEIREGLASIEAMDIEFVPHVLKIVNDVTELRRLEREIHHIDRLTIVGEMAASISHEIRNPMTTIRGFLQLLKRKDECKRFANYFETMIDELDRANSIISESLLIARKNSNKMELHNLNSIIGALYPLIQANAIQFDMNISMELNSIPSLSLDEQAIRQLILNLCRNGLEAMKSRGVLSIKTFMRDSKVILEVEDQGTGIDPEIMDKMGKPFYTTKENGTGLGIPICNRIADLHRAEIKIKTDTCGTIFSVHFKMP